MRFLREQIVPLLIFLVFLVALVAASARIFLPSDMAAPAPTEDSPSFVSFLVGDNDRSVGHF